MKQNSLYLFIFLLLWCFDAHAQIEGTKVGLLAGNRPAIAQQEIQAAQNGYEYKLLGVDTTESYLCVVLKPMSQAGKNKSILQMYSLPSLKMVWEKDFKEDIHQIAFTSSGILVGTTQKLIIFDKESGQQQWKSTGFITYFDDATETAIAYNQPKSSSLTAYNISERKEKWTSSLPHHRFWGWDHVTSIGNNHDLFIIGDDYNLLSINTGKMRNLPAKTGIQDMQATSYFATNYFVAYYLWGALGAGIYASDVSKKYDFLTDTNILTGLTSNLLEDNGLYYISDREHFTCFDEHLNQRFQVSLPTRKAGAAQLFPIKDSLYMVNYAFGINGEGDFIRCGTPFLASFDKASGVMKSLSYLTDEKKYLKGAAPLADQFFLLFNDCPALFNPKDLTINSDPNLFRHLGDIKEIVTSDAYGFDQTANQLVSLYPRDEHCAIITKFSANMPSRISIIDKKLNILQTFNTASVFNKEKEEYSLNKLVGRNQTYLLADKAYQPLCYVNLPYLHEVIVRQENIYILNDYGLFILDRKNL